jgi:hypothetical protein
VKEAVSKPHFPLLDRESFLSCMKPPLIPVIRGQICINLTQTGLKHDGFMQNSHIRRPWITALDICIGEEFHKPFRGRGVEESTPLKAFGAQNCQGHVL